MTTDRMIMKLTPWDGALAEALIRERDEWLDSAANICIMSSRTRDDAVDWLADAMEEHLREAVNDLIESTPSRVLMAMDGMCQLDPNLSYMRIADALLEDYWPRGTSKPVRYVSRSKPKASNNRKPKAKKASARRR